MIADGKVELIDEPTYRLGSADNLRNYPNECALDPASRATSVHGLLVDGEPILVVATYGGATGVHEHSSVHVHGSIYFAIGSYVCRFTPGHTTLDWHLEVDGFTCFGVHYSQEHKSFIAHGEMSIARFTPDGQISWQRGGADIFTGKVSLRADHIEAVDFNERRYSFAYDGPEEHDADVADQRS